MHKVFHKVCRLLHLTVAWAQRGVIKGSRAHPACQAAQGTGLTQWFSPALSAGYGGCLDQDVLGQARGSTHRLFWNACVCNVWRETLPEFYIWICSLFPSSSRVNSVISIGSPASWFVLEHRTAGCPHLQLPGTQSSAAGRGPAAPVPSLVQHHFPRTHAWFVTDILNFSSKLECLTVGKMQPKDTNILVISLQYHLRPSTENCCMSVFLKHGNWVFLGHQAWDGGREFGGLRRCC